MKRLNELSKMLDKLIELHNELIVSGRDKRKAITRNDLEEIKAISDAESALGDELRQVETARIEIVKTIAKENKLNTENPKLMEIIELTANPLRKKLTAQRSELLMQIENLSRINRDNMMLLEASLEYMDTFLNLLTGDEDPKIYVPKTSAGTARKKSIARTALLDQTA